MEKVQKLIMEKGDWMGRVVSELTNLPKHADPTTLASQFIQVLQNKGDLCLHKQETLFFFLVQYV